MSDLIEELREAAYILWVEDGGLWRPSPFDDWGELCEFIAEEATEGRLGDGFLVTDQAYRFTSIGKPVVLVPKEPPDPMWDVDYREN